MRAEVIREATVLTERGWAQVEHEYAQSNPYNYSVLDDFFTPEMSFMHQRNVGLKVHADNGAVTVDVWMTPDEFNLSPEAGGLVFFDVKRDLNMLIHEFNTVEWAERYYNEHTKGASEKISYRCNRAVLFDASTFHESDTVSFREEGAHTYRINLSLLFDDPEEFARRRKEYDD